MASPLASGVHSIQQSPRRAKKKLPLMSDIEAIEKKENKAFRDKYKVKNKDDLDAIRSAYQLL